MSLFDLGPTLLPVLVAIVLGITGWVVPPSSIAQDSTSVQVIEQLALTPFQAKKIGNLNAKYQQRLDRASQQSQQAEQELTDLLLAKAPKAQIQAKYKQLTTAKQQLASLMYEKFVGVHEVLTPEQLSKLAEARP
ncbi:MAG: Spy/CpxP family protein refolding chaperone [Leptolyngbyaceae bacterium]|nr:Spy/CpxP family protein refolding chaperone [Leptolyngbyaceae bacterium]